MDNEEVVLQTAPKDPVQARLETYKIKGATAEWEWGHNPYYTPEQYEEARNEDMTAAWYEFPVFASTFLGVFSLVPGLILTLGADASGSMDAATERSSGLTALAIAGVLFLPLVFLLLHFQVKKFLNRNEVVEEKPDHLARMRADLHAAWEDWEYALSSTGELEGGDHAHNALLEQDPALRTAFHTYLNDATLSRSHKAKFEQWFLQTCAEAYELHLAELERSELYMAYTTSNAITAAIETPNNIAAAKEQSRVISATVRDALGDQAVLADPFTHDKVGKGEVRLALEYY